LGSSARARKPKKQFGDIIPNTAKQSETRRVFGGFSVSPVGEWWQDRLRRIPNDNDATLPYARADARAMLARGDKLVVIHRARLKLPSGIVGWRFFAIGEENLTRFPRWVHGGGASEAVESYTSEGAPPP
jgi:hypothetical protein